MSFIRCHTRQSIAASLSKRAACLRKSCSVIFDRSGRSVDPSGWTRMAIGGGKSRILSPSARARQRLKIGRYRVNWEGDLLSGSKNSYIATLVERHTRYVLLAKVANKDTQ